MFSNSGDTEIEANIVLYEGFDILELASSISALSASNEIRNTYSFSLFSKQGGLIKSSSDIGFVTRALDNITVRQRDLVVMVGPITTDVDLLLDLIHHQPTTCRLCVIGCRDVLAGISASPESAVSNAQDQRGAWIRPRAGLVATQAGSIWCGIGKAATLDLMLTIVAEDHGRSHALQVAEALLLYVWRAPDELVPSAMMMWQRRAGARFAELNDHIRTNLTDDLDVERLAAWCGMSVRTFTRRYRHETGMTPAAAVTGMRLEAARLMMRESGVTLSEVAHRVGFGSELTFRRAFVRAYGDLPTRWR